MKSPMRFFLQAIALALLSGLILFGGSFLYTQVLDGRLSEAIRSCKVASRNAFLENQRDLLETPKVAGILKSTGNGRYQFVDEPEVKDADKISSASQMDKSQNAPSDKWDELEKEYSQKKNASVPSDGNQNPFDKFDKVETKGFRPWELYKYHGMGCEPSELDALRENDINIQLVAPHFRSVIEILHEKSNIKNYEPLGFGIIFLILVVGVMPALWYFFLRRLKEVAAAIRGN